jgi:hypothetical protein
MMRLFRHCFGFILALFFLVAVAQPAEAASSAAIRAYDDVSTDTKDYSGQDLVRAEFSNARLVNANFNGADLRGAVFNGSVLTGANLHGVDFSDGIAYLRSRLDRCHSHFCHAVEVKLPQCQRHRS